MTGSRPRRARLNVEMLEDRVVPATFNVNSLADVLNPTAGVITLRSAMQAANTTPGSNTIDLTIPGTYRINLPGRPGEADNAAGELALTGTGNYTLQNTSGGTVVINGGGRTRVFDINPAAENTTPFTVTFQGITITDGNASPGDSDQGSGGGIRAQGAASVVLDNVVLTGNTATADGGGISLESLHNDSIGTLTVNASTVSHNHAGDAGGGIETDGTGLVTVNAGTVIDFNTCVNQGAGIWLDAGGAALTVTGSIISNNNALTMLAGGIGNAGAGNVTITNSLIQNNFSGGTGGGFGDAANMGNLTVQDSFFINNTAVGDGGGIQEGGPQTTITGLTFEGNVSGGNGGGLFVNGQTVNITDTVFRQNVAVSGGGVEDEALAFAVSTSTFDTNLAQSTNGGNGNNAGNGGNGGAIDVPSAATSVAVSNCLFLDNTTNGNGQGGAINDDIGTLAVTTSQFAGNVCALDGGAIFDTGTTCNITQSTFNGNSAVFGGAVQDGAAGTFANDTFTANYASNSSGAISFGNGQAALTLLDDTFNNNTAANHGGAIEMPDLGPAMLTIQNTIFAGDSPSEIFSVATTPITDGGGNLISSTSGVTGFGAGTQVGVNPKLGQLENNGGQYAGAFGDQQIVQTEALLPGSPAIGTGVASGAPTTDQRGFHRPGGGGTNPSIGAYEPQFAANASANQVFVENVYEVLLNRTADAGGLAAWTNLLNNGTTPTAVVLAIEGSTEYRIDEVQTLYQRYLHRQADPGGLNFWVNGLAHGSTIEQIAAGIAGSSEYFQLHGGNNLAFLDALYEDALGRLPDPFGLDSFSQALAGGATPAAVAALVFGSPEYQQNLVETGYQAILGRQADPGGLAFFEQALANGTTDQMLLADLLGSGESFGERT